MTQSCPILLAASVSSGAAPTDPPSLFWCWPFVFLLLAIAVFPLIPRVSHWWNSNRSKLLVSVALAGVVCAYYFLRGHGPDSQGMKAVAGVLHHSIINDYIPFIILLFSLYTISGGIRLSGDIPAHPATNAGFLLLGAVLANIIGTKKTAMPMLT